MSKISLKHSGGNVVSLNSPTNAPGAADVAFKLPNADGSDGQALVTDGAGNLSFANAGSSGRARNLIINGAMQVAQRGTSSTTHPAYGADRWRWGFGNHSAGTVTASQQSLSSSDSGPWEKGFRNYTRLALGQAGTAAANTYISMRYKVEAQDITNSGWDYTSGSSNITISFWFRCSTNQTFYFGVKSEDGTQQSYVSSFTASGNNTWTKVTKTIPGNSSIQIDNDNGAGLSLWFYQFYGTDETNNKTLNQWAAHSASNLMPDMASTWLTAGASTWDLTGVQLEVGSVATDFEHRSFGQELALCERYCEATKPRTLLVTRFYGSSGPPFNYFMFRTQKRATPTISTSGTTFETSTGFGAPTFASINENGSRVYINTTMAANGAMYIDYQSGDPIIIDAEL